MAELSGQGPVLAPNVTTLTHTTAQTTVGNRMRDTAGNEYVYAKATEAIGPGGWAVFDGSWNATRVLTASRGALGVSQTTMAANDFGWFKIYGVEDAAQIGQTDSEATSVYALIAPTGATTEPTMAVTSTLATSVVSAAYSNPVFGAWIKAAASTGTTASSSSFSGCTVQVGLNYPFLQGLLVERTGST